MSMAEYIHKVPDLFLIRHAKSDYPPGVSDHERPLSPRGRQDAAVAANWLEAAEIVHGPTVVLVSSARRAQDTWAILSTGLARSPDSGIQVFPRPDLYEAGVGAVLALITEAFTAGTSGTQSLIVIGHNPTLHATALHLAGASAAGSLIAERFPTCAMAVLRMKDDQSSLVHVEVPRARSIH